MARWGYGLDATNHFVSYQSSAYKTVHMMKIYSKERFDRLPDAILFDTDNTLYPYDPAHAAAQRAVRDKVVKTFSIKPADFDKTFKEAREQVKSRLKGTASSHSRLLYLQRMLELMELGSQVPVS